jgi:hypothetical protein
VEVSRCAWARSNARDARALSPLPRLPGTAAGRSAPRRARTSRRSRARSRGAAWSRRRSGRRGRSAGRGRGAGPG